MPNLFFEVHLSRDEEMARNINYVEKFLVELICEEHTKRPIDYLKDSAIEIARQTLQPEVAKIIGYKEAFKLEPDSVPSNRNPEGTTAPCGCRSWHF